MSMMSGMRRASSEFVESFITGVIGFPVGVPSPVVKTTTFAPAPTCALTHSTSLPGVLEHDPQLAGKTTLTGTPMRAGPNVGVGTDHTLFALVHGRVQFARKGPEQRTFVSVLPEAAAATH